MNTPRISKSTGAIMIAFAALFDLIQFFVNFLAIIPVIGIVLVAILGPFISFIASISFGIWCSHLGVSLLDSKRSLGFLGTIVGEFVPVIDSAPFWTCLIAY